jgi:phosphohistidine phosphatase
MTKTLLLMRHGKSSWKDKSLPDIKRPLKKRGEEASEEMGHILKHKKLLPDVILTSPAKRARHSAEIAAKEAGISDRVKVVDSLYMAEVKEIFDMLQGLEGNPDRVMIVGHNPGLEAALQLLDGHVESLPTGATAYLRLDIDDWKSLSIDTTGDMIGFWNPDKEKDNKKEKK